MRIALPVIAAALVVSAFVIVSDAHGATVSAAELRSLRAQDATCRRVLGSGTARARACTIRRVWPGTAHDAKAVSVARCESGPRIDPRARNGQYRGAFQMGSAERRRYGHGHTVLAQAIAARAYWRVAGWGPWACA